MRPEFLRESLALCCVVTWGGRSFQALARGVDIT